MGIMLDNVKGSRLPSAGHVEKRRASESMTWEKNTEVKGRL